MITYIVWSVYEGNSKTSFYVVNRTTKQVQSVWDELMTARQVASNLNNIAVSSPKILIS